MPVQIHTVGDFAARFLRSGTLIARFHREGLPGAERLLARVRDQQEDEKVSINREHAPRAS